MAACPFGSPAFSLLDWAKGEGAGAEPWGEVPEVMAENAAPVAHEVRLGCPSPAST